MKLTKDQIEQNHASLVQLLQETERPGIDSLIEWLETETDYFEAPASTRLDYHGCYEGGLAEHSANVYMLFLQKRDQFHLDVSNDEVIIASLLHDVCKVNYYVPNINKTGKNRGQPCASKPYKVEDTLPLGHGEKSLYLAAQHIDLTPTEALLIRWHMGPFDPAWESVEPRMGKSKLREACPAIYAFSSADQEASKYVDK